MDTSKISNLISKKNNSIELFSLKNIIQSNFQNFNVGIIKSEKNIIKIIRRQL